METSRPLFTAHPLYVSPIWRKRRLGLRRFSKACFRDEKLVRNKRTQPLMWGLAKWILQKNGRKYKEDIRPHKLPPSPASCWQTELFGSLWTTSASMFENANHSIASAFTVYSILVTRYIRSKVFSKAVLFLLWALFFWSRVEKKCRVSKDV